MEAPTNDTGAIPLVCKICPKKPEFSDISHLLTHIGSKGHLSNYYRGQVLGAQEPEYQTLVAEYDDWYARYNIRDLMSQRLGQKAERKTRNETARRQQESGGTNPSPRHGSAAEHPSVDAQVQSKDADVKPIPNIKSEFLPQSPTTIGAYQNCGSHLYSLPFHPYLQDWHTLPWSTDGFMNSPVVKYAASDSGGPGESPWITDGTSTLPLASGPLCGTEDELVLNETITDSSKMKGIYWQGMAMFDSATPEMKKKRNQKKGTAVLEQLQATSEDIRPSEMVFDTEWTHRRTRAITGSPANSNKEQSPLVGETTPEPDVPPKKRKSRQPRRKTLAECDVNSGVVKRAQPRKRKSAAAVKNEPSDPTPNDDNDGIVSSKRSSRKRRGFSIHRDNTGPEITFNESNPSSNVAAGSGQLTTAHCSLPVTDLHDSTLSLTPLYGSSHVVDNNDISSLMGFRPAGVFTSAVSALPNLSSFGQLNFGNQPLFQSVVFPANSSQQFVSPYGNANYLPAPSSIATQNHLPVQTTPLWLSLNHAGHDSSSLYSNSKAGARTHFNAASLRVPDRSSFGSPMASNDEVTSSTSRGRITD